MFTHGIKRQHYIIYSRHMFFRLTNFLIMFSKEFFKKFQRIL